MMVFLVASINENALKESVLKYNIGRWWTDITDQPWICKERCGDKFVVGKEQCNDGGNYNDADGCKDRNISVESDVNLVIILITLVQIVYQDLFHRNIIAIIFVEMDQLKLILPGSIQKTTRQWKQKG